VDAVPLDGRKALVLGAGTPAGRAVAIALAEAGANVAVASSSLDGEEVMACRRTRRAIEKLGRRSVEYAFDVTLGQNVQVSTRQVAKEMGGLDILVWAVHAPFSGPSDKVSDSEWTRCLAVNLNGAFFACRAALREMAPHGWGRILLMEDGPNDPWSQHAPIRAAQWGVMALTHVLSEEFGNRGVAVHHISIDPRYAGMTSGTGEWEPEWPREAGALAAYLSSSAADDMNGKLFVAYLGNSVHT
jgi:NAD(P)-dependent dehydrogenase (short-subunit alcohol dehydrogenase family)